MKEDKKTDSETGVQNDFTFCLEPPIEKTNSDGKAFGVVGLFGFIS